MAIFKEFADLTVMCNLLVEWSWLFFTNHRCFDLVSRSNDPLAEALFCVILYLFAEANL